MIQRCTNQNNPRWKDYGGRGIRVCLRWRNSFSAFFYDMGERLKGMTLERINNDGNYEISNCKWASYLEQSQNSRHVKPFVFRGVEYTVRTASQTFRLPVTTIRERIYCGWTIERTLTQPRQCQPYQKKKAGLK